MDPIRPEQSQIFRARMIFAGSLLLLIVLVGASGYHVLGDGRWSVEDVLYFTVITLSTVGFGETLPGMHSIPYVRLWTMGLIIFGSGTLLYFVSTLTAFIVESDFQQSFRRNRMQKRIEKLRDHYILCGVGATGIHVVEEMINTHHAFVVVDRDVERLVQLTERYGPQRFLYVEGDATDDETLRQANIAHAAGIVAALTDDKDNLYITLSAYQLERERADRGEFRIVAKAIDRSARAKLVAAGAHRVVSPSQIGGMRMASEMIRPAVVEFLDLMLRDPKKNLRIEEVEIPDDSPMVGAELRNTAIRRHTQVLVIAAKKGSDPVEYIYNPGPDLRIEERMTLIVLAETRDMNRLRDGIESGRIGRL